MVKFLSTDSHAIERGKRCLNRPFDQTDWSWTDTNKGGTLTDSTKSRTCLTNTEWNIDGPKEELNIADTNKVGTFVDPTKSRT